MNMNHNIKRILTIPLLFSVLCTSVNVTVFAETNDIVVSCAETTHEENIHAENLCEENLQENNQHIDNSYTENANVNDADNCGGTTSDEKSSESDTKQLNSDSIDSQEYVSINADNSHLNAENTPNTQNAIDNDDTPTAVDSSQAYNLSTDQLSEKSNLINDLEDLDAATPGEDYVYNELILECETKEEAEEIASIYQEELGIEVTVEEFAYEIATLRINPDVKVESNEPVDATEYTSLDDTNLLDDSNVDYVAEAVELAADISNSLPAVYPNYYEELCTVEKTENEHFEDPFTKETDSNYQWYHEIIGDKFVWDEMDEIESVGVASYDGPLNSNFVNNLNDMTVAVIDTGINSGHEDFDASMLIGGYNAVSDTEGIANIADDNGHGTNVAGIIGNVANNKGGRGVASGVNILPIKINNGSSISSSHVIRALNFVAEKADNYNIKVVNLSLGSTSYQTLYSKTLDRLRDKNILVCAAAGNYNSNMEFYPAAYDSTISVGSVNSSLSKSSFSNYGSKVTIAAPGGENSNVIRESSLSKCTENLYASAYDSNSGYTGAHGTSQASPVVAASAALIFANNPSLSADDVKNIIVSSATKIQSGYDLGTGCINVAKALGIYGVMTPRADIQSGEISDSCDISLGIGADFTLTDYDGLIYYTLDGGEPSINDTSGSTIFYNGTPGAITPIHIDYDSGKENTTLKVRSYLYGVESEVNTYTYYFNKSKVRSVTISSVDGSVNATGSMSAAVGSKLTLKAEILPTYANNKSIKWESSNTSIATVSSNGVVSILSAGKTSAAGTPGALTTVAITATALDGSDVQGTFDIEVMPLATRVEIEAPEQTGGTKLYDSQTVLLYVNENDTYKLGANTSDPDCKWHVWPKNALQEVGFKSSNNKVATVDASGTIHAVGTGTATITVTSADGTNKQDTIKVKCETSISKIDITDKNSSRDKNGESYVIAGKKFTPQVIFNDNQSKPDNTTLVWEIISGGNYATINTKTGVVTAKTNQDIGTVRTVAIRAYSTKYCDEYGDVIEGTFTLKVYPITTEFSTRADSSTMSLGDTYKFANQITGIKPAGTLGKYKYKSSNANVLYVNPETGEALALKKGNTKVTITADDGSNKSVSIPVSILGSITKLGLINKSGTTAIYPGKSLNFSAVASDDSEIKPGELEWYFLDNSKNHVSETEYLSVKNGTVTVKNEAKKLTDEDNNKSTLYAALTLDVNSTQKTYTASVDIEVYPGGTSSLVLDSNALYFDEIGKEQQLNVTSYPELSYGRGYKYNTTNKNVATVDSKGVIRAIGNGTAYIDALAGDNSGKKARCKIIVEQKPVSVTIYQSNNLTSVASGKKLTLSAKVNSNPNEYPAKNTGVVWSLVNPTDEQYVTISTKNGIVIAHSGTLEQHIVRVRASSVLDAGVYGEYDITVCPVTQSLTLAQSEATIRTELTARMTPIDNDYPEYYFIDKPDISPANASCELTAKSLNEKIATVAPEFDNGELTGWRVIPRAKGTAKIKITAEDGSGKNVSFTVNVIKPLTNLRIEPKTGIYSMKPGTKLYMKSIMDASPTNSGVDYYLTDPEEMGQFATIDKTSGAITAKNAKTIGTASPKVRVYAVARDGWHDTSEPIEITILPGVILMEDLNVISSNNRYDVAGGTSLQMKATTTTDATDKSIKWYLGDDTGEKDMSAYASIDSRGLLKSKASITEKKTVRVYAQAKDVGGVIGYHDITLYKKADSFSIDSFPTSEIHSMKAGADLYLIVNTESNNPSELCNKYKVTYTTGAAKVYLCSDDDGAGTIVRVRGLSKGKTTVYFESMDGTNKKKSYSVNITQ